MKHVTIVVVGLLFTFALLAQETAKNVAELTNAEQLELRGAQVDLLQAQTALQATAEYKQFQEAQKRFQDAVLQVYQERKISSADYVLCDGPQTPACVGLKPHQLALKPQPKTTAEKKP